MNRSTRLQTAIEEFLLGLANTHTRQNFRSDLKVLVGHLGPITGTESKRQVIEFLRTMQSQGLKASTIRGRTIRLRQLFDHLMSQGFCKENPVCLENAPKSKDYRRPKSPDLKELKSIFSQLNYQTFEDHRDALCISLLFFEALRVHEVCGLKRENISSVNGKTLLEFSGKGGRQDTVFLFPQTEKVLQSYLKQYPVNTSKGPLLYSKKQPVAHLTTRAIRKRVESLFEKAQVRKGLSCHSLRHAHAQVLASQGYPLTGVQRRLRHSSPLTSLKYYYGDDQSFYPSTLSQPEKLLDFKIGRTL